MQMKKLIQMIMSKTKQKDSEIHGIVHALRKKNFKIRIQHRRYVEIDNIAGDSFIELQVVTKISKQRNFNNILGKGGETKLDLTTPDGITVTETAKCNILDGYNKKLGVRIALGRALKKAGVQELNLVNFK